MTTITETTTETTTQTGRFAVGVPAGDRHPTGGGPPGAGATGHGRAPWSPADTVADGDGHLRGEQTLCVGEAA
ncbi:MAG: hypothetical protein M0029_12760 [Actinomycetota bacterium]|jgi:hypothetical protein|nr:hypothetical protein [Actinomycetota bacterium]